MCNFKRFILIFCIIVFVYSVNAQNIQTGKSNSKIIEQNLRISKAQIPFIANNGQIHENVKFYARTFAGTVFITKSGDIVYSVPKIEIEEYLPDTEKPGKSRINSGIVLKEEFVNAKITDIKGLVNGSVSVNYFKGNASSEWKRDIPSYETVSLGEKYAGIDIKLRAFGNNVEKLFYINPGSDPENIKVKIQGSKGLKINEDGMLDIETDLGNVSFTKPAAYQECAGKKQYINVNYRVNGDEYGFEVGEYDPDKLLVIDPLIGSTLIGGNGGEFCKAIALDSNENVYIVGNTSSANFPTTVGVFDEDYNEGDGDVFLCKFSSDLTTLISSTFIGGIKDEVGNFVIIDDEDNVYITGYTLSENFPTTSGSYDESYNGGDADVFIAKFDNDLKNLLISTFIGGSGRESDWRGPVIKLDKNGNIYLAGRTSSEDFPTTSDSYDPEFNGGSDVFITKLDAYLTKIIASTYLGGSGGEMLGNSLEISPTEDKIYVNGLSMGSGFPRIEGSYTLSVEGGGGSFVSMFDKDLKTLTASSVVDGGWHYCMALDKDGNVFVGGHGGNYPTTSGAFLEKRKNSIDGAYISKYDGNLTKLLASTYIGGSVSGESAGSKVPLSLAVDKNGDLIASGWTKSIDHPTTPGAYDETHNGINDNFVLKFDNHLKSLIASTFIGGSDKERWNYFALGNSGNIYLSSYSLSADFPTTKGAFSEKQNGGTSDAFVVKLSNDLSANTILEAHDAAKKDEIERLKKALTEKPASIEEKDKYKRTPLHWAARYGSINTARFLLEKDADISAGDEKGNIPLHLTSIYNHPKIAEMLLSAGTDIKAKNDDGNTPLHLSAKFSANEVLELLISKGPDINITNVEGNTPLHLAVKYNYREIMETLFSAKADLHSKNNEGANVLFTALQSRNAIEVIEFLLNNGSDLNTKDNEGRTPLHYAFSNYTRKPNIKLLLEKGSEINSQDNNGKTALHQALEAGTYYNDLVREMIEKGADITVKDNDGKTLLDIANEKKNNDMIELLQSKLK